MDALAIHSVILYVLALVLFIVAFWIWKTYERSNSIYYYTSFLLGLALMALLSALGLSVKSVDSLTWISRFGFVAGAWTFLMLYMFSFYYPTPSRWMLSPTVHLWAYPLAFLIPYILFNPDFVISVTRSNIGIEQQLGRAYFIFPLFCAAVFTLTVANFIKKLRVNTGAARSNAAFVMYVIIISSAFGLIADVILPFTEINFPHHIAVEGTVIVLGATIMTVLKK